MCTHAHLSMAWEVSVGSLTNWRSSSTGQCTSHGVCRRLLTPLALRDATGGRTVGPSEPFEEFEEPERFLNRPPGERKLRSLLKGLWPDTCRVERGWKPSSAADHRREGEGRGAAGSGGPCVTDTCSAIARLCSLPLTSCVFLPRGGRCRDWSTAPPATGCLRPSRPEDPELLLPCGTKGTLSTDLTSERAPHVGQGTSSEGTGRRQVEHQCSQ